MVSLTKSTHFKLQDVRNGKYELYISFIGYATKVVPEVELTLKTGCRLGDIYMVPENITLNAVGSDRRARPDREPHRQDRIQCRPGCRTTVGGDAVDVLRKAPLLSVDFDGNVSPRLSERADP